MQIYLILDIYSIYLCTFQEFRENHTDATVSFTVCLSSSEKMAEFEREKNGGLFSKFKLSGKISTSNMLAFNEEGAIERFDTAAYIMRKFYDLRLEFYVKRKAILLQKLRREERMLSNKARFVLAVCDGELIVSNRKKAELLNELKEEGYEMFTKEENDDTSEDDEVDGNDLAAGYSYLLNMKLWSLTYEKVEQLKAEHAETQEKVKELEETSETQIWLNNLDDLEDAIDERDAQMEAAEKDEVQAIKKNNKRQTKAKKKAVSRKEKKGGWDSDVSESSDEEVVLMSESDDDFKTKPVKNSVPKKRAAPATKKASVKSTTKPTDGSKVKAPLAKSTTNKMVVTKPVKAIDLELSSSDDDIEDEHLSLFDRMKKKKAFGSVRDSRGRKIEGTAALLNVDTKDDVPVGKKRASPRNGNLSDSEDDFLADKKKVMKKPRRPLMTKAEKSAGSPLRKNKSQSQSSSAIDIDSDSDLGFSKEIVSDKKAKTTSVKKAVTTKKKPVSKSTKNASPIIELSDDEIDSDSVVETPPPRATSSRRSGRTTVNYAKLSSGEDIGEEDEPSFEEESEDDFEFDE